MKKAETGSVAGILLKKFLNWILDRTRLVPIRHLLLNTVITYTGTVPVYDKPNSGILWRCRFCTWFLNLPSCFLDKESVGVVIRETLFSIIRVHINIVHDYGPRAHGSVIVGQQPGRNWGRNTMIFVLITGYVACRVLVCISLVRNQVFCWILIWAEPVLTTIKNGIANMFQIFLIMKRITWSLSSKNIQVKTWIIFSFCLLFLPCVGYPPTH
jgi:hypothetical protein